MSQGGVSHVGNSRRLRVLTFSTLFPSSARPGHGIFVETRLRELVASGAVESRVVAPVPWFPSTHPRYGEYARMAATPKRETLNGLDVLHPSYFLPPKIGMTVAPLLLALGARAAVQKLIDEGFDFDVIDAHYYYPDGVAAALLARWFGKPFTVTARGSDLNLIPLFTLPRRMMQWAARQAAASIGVSSALVQVLRSWGLNEERLHVMRNGVDLQRFRPVPQPEARARLGLAPASPVLVCVGNLQEHKGQRLLVEAMAQLAPRLPGVQLLLVGEGPDRAALESRAAELGLSAQIRLVGARPNTELLDWFSAADVSLLVSSREGWANVLLESMACGTPVIATNVGGSAEVIGTSGAGWLVRERNPAAVAAAIESALGALPARTAVRAYAQGFSWQATTEAQLALFGRICNKAFDGDAMSAAASRGA